MMIKQIILFLVVCFTLFSTHAEEKLNDLYNEMYLDFLRLGKQDEALEFLKLADNINLNYVYEKGPSMFDMTASFGNASLVEYFFENGVKVSYSDLRESTMLACVNGQSEILEVLLKNGATLKSKSNGVNEHGPEYEFSCLGMAIEQENAQMLDIVLKYGLLEEGESFIQQSDVKILKSIKGWSQEVSRKVSSKFPDLNLD